MDQHVRINSQAAIASHEKQHHEDTGVLKLNMNNSIIPMFGTLGFTDYAILAWILITFGGGAVYATRQRSDLRRLDRKLDALLKQQGVSLPPIISEEVQRIVRDPAKKRDAIKLHQEQTGLDLADATADVEAFLAGKH